MIITFGKHKGWPVDELPDGYLQWLFWLDTLNPDIEQAIKTEVAARWPDKIQLLIKPPKQPRQRQPRTKKTALEHQAKIKTIFRELAMQYHPDTGGDTAAMAAINEFYERLKGI